MSLILNQLSINIQSSYDNILSRVSENKLHRKFPQSQQEIDQLDVGSVALAGRGHSILVSVQFGQTRRTSPVDGTHGNPIESQHNQTSSEQPENQVASAERVRPLRTVAAVGKQLSIQAENNQYFDGMTPPPTDKSGRGGKGKRQKMSKLSPGSTSPTKKEPTSSGTGYWKSTNPNRKRSPEQEADKTRSS
ncbi:hypothetical protein J6590_089094 [Homalodisca vitripennis]|nr:hypothetical protein J6590_089094 [Homalodisca vitripennis]